MLKSLYSGTARTLARARVAVKNPPRLIYVATRPYLDTVHALVTPLAKAGVGFDYWSYARFLNAPWRPRAAYILSDFDRIHPSAIERAGEIRRSLMQRGLPVLNDPVRFVPRAALIRRLHAAGVNEFTCWLPAFGEEPARFPVFLRTIHSHGRKMSPLLDGPEAAAQALEDMLAEGFVISDLVFIEYCHAPPREGDAQRRKLACYRIGDAIIPGLTVTELGWPVRAGDVNSATPEDYAADLAELDDYPHTEAMRRVFDLADCEFGRADFGIVNGRPQIYEINTNPFFGFWPGHPNADRRATDEEIKRRIIATLVTFAESAGRTVRK